MILIGLQTRGGSGVFADAELGPIAAALPDGPHVCCELGFVDTLENRLSLPDVCFDGVGFGTMKPEEAAGNETVSLVPAAAIETSGALVVTNCVTAGVDGRPAALGQDRPQFLFAFHGQAVGPYGIAVSAKYPR